MDLPEALERLQVELGHVPLLGQVPVTAGVIFEERATVQLDRPLIVIDSMREMAGDPVCVCLAEFGKELVAVYPPLQLGVQHVAPVLIDDGLEALPRSVEGVPQAVQGNVEVIASRGMGV